MTTLQLFGYIGTALLLQLMAGLALLVWRRPSATGRVAVGAPPTAGEAVLAQPSSAAWLGWREFRVTRRRFEDEAQTQCSFELQPLDGQPLKAFRPGQYLTFALSLGEQEAAPAAQRRLTRCYSISAPPDPGSFQITVKRVPSPAGQPELPPGAASQHLHEQVREGAVLQVRAPSGHFFIDEDAKVPAVFIAGGIGITPLISMLRWCLANQPERRLHLFYGVRSRADHAFKEALETLAAAHLTLQLHVVYGSPGPDDVQGRDFQHTGRIDLDRLRSSLPHGRHQFYVCGPPPMMQSLVPALREWGVEESDLHFEAFGPASVRPTAPASNEPVLASEAAFEVRLRRSGRTLVWDSQDANLLDFAERHGVAADSGCRTGSCGTCETRLVSGSVAYAEKPDHETAAGHCLLCVGKPTSALELDL